MVGLAGGVLGLLLAFGALALIGMQSQGHGERSRTWTGRCWPLTFVHVGAAAMLAGLLPTWRACQVTPAIQLKSQ